MSELRVEPTPATLGAVVSGVALARLDDATWTELEAAFHQHALLIFPDQHLSEEEQVAFGRRFGAIERIVGSLELIAITNQRPDGGLLADDHPGMKIMKGNEGWHTDSSYMPVSAKASILSAHVVPACGGETEWADMRAAWDALDDDTRGRIEGLSAFHSIRYAQKRIGDESEGIAYGFEGHAPPLRPLSKVHPVTGRRALFIGRHAYGIPGLGERESEALLDELLDRACRPPRTFLHRWSKGDVAVWDNRCVLHRARPFDHAEPRLMKHVRISGDAASEGVAS